ncbi:MAG: O-antigen ligase family protein, partial [Planctomycetota bacterium]
RTPGRSPRAWLSAAAAGSGAAGSSASAGAGSEAVRGGAIAMVSSFLVVLAMLRMRLSRVLPTLAALLILSVVFLMSIGPSSPIARLGTIYASLTTGLNGRAEVWESAWQTWKSFPVLGTGIGTYAEVTSPNYNPVDIAFRDKFAAHGESEYVEMLVEAGLVGLGLLFVIVFDLFRKTLLAVRQAPKGMRTLLLGCLFGITTITTQSLADFPLHVAGVTVPAVVLASKMYRLGLCKEEEESQANPNEGNRFLPGLQRLVVTLKNIALLVTACILVPYQASQVKLERLIEQAQIPLPGAQWVTTDIPRYSRPVLETMKTALINSLKIRPDWAEGHTRLGQVQLALYRHAAAEALGMKLVTFEPDLALEGDNFVSRDETELDKPQPGPDPEPEAETATKSKPRSVVPPKEGTIDPDTGKIVEPATDTPSLGTSPLDNFTSSDSALGQNSSGTPLTSEDESPNTINTPFGAFTLPAAKVPRQKATAPATPPLGTGEAEAIPSRTNKTKSSRESEEPEQDETLADVLTLHK